MSTPRTSAAKFQSSQDPDVYNVVAEFSEQLETELDAMTKRFHASNGLRIALHGLLETARLDIIAERDKCEKLKHALVENDYYMMRAKCECTVKNEAGDIDRCRRCEILDLNNQTLNKAQ